MHEENLAKVERNLRRQSQEIIDEIDRAADRLAGNPSVAPTLADARHAAVTAGKLADGVRAGGTEAARLATEELILAIQQLAAAVTTAGEILDRKVVDLPNRHLAGDVTRQARAVAADGRTFAAAPTASAETPHFFPGGTVGGRAVPRGWYSVPWWRDVAAHQAAAATGVTLTLGALAHEFYDKVLAPLPGQTSTADWAAGIAPPPRLRGELWLADDGLLSDLFVF